MSKFFDLQRNQPELGAQSSNNKKEKKQSMREKEIKTNRNKNGKTKHREIIENI